MMKTSWDTRSATAESDFIYLRQGEEITDVKKILQLNGNKFVSLELDGNKLVAEQDYTLDGDVLTVKAGLLQGLNHSGELGKNAVLTAVFDKGKSWDFNVITYTTPVLQSTVGTTSDFAIPTAFNGDHLATMEAVYTDGSFAGPQNWTSFKEFAYTFSPSYDNNKIILKQKFFNEVNDGTVKLTLHFWSGEALTYTITKNGEIVAGFVEETVASSGNMTRADFIQMVMNTFELLDGTVVSSFADVVKDSRYANANSKRGKASYY